jgi:protein phosphatase
MMIVSTAEEMNPIRRSTMEDVHVIHEEGTWNCKDPNMAFLGIFDGHGGTSVVNAFHTSFNQD